METTKFYYSDARAATTRGQIAIYAVAAVLSVAIVIGGIMAARARASEPVKPVDPHSFQAELGGLFEMWKRDVLHSTPTPAPAIRPAQVPPPTATPASVAVIQGPAATPEPPTDAMMAEWRHIPPGMEANYAAYEQRRDAAQAQQPTPRPTPYLLPEVVATPDPVAAKHAEWKTMRDAYAQQQLVRARNAKTDAEKGAIQREIALWRQNNPEPPKAAATPNADEIPIH